jgi:hypothetical protein
MVLSTSLRIVSNASMFLAEELYNKIFLNEAEIARLTGSSAQNLQRRYQEFYSEDWTAIYLHLVLDQK